jgi:hypothetical protein
MADLRQVMQLAKRTDSKVQIQIVGDEADALAYVFTTVEAAQRFATALEGEWPFKQIDPERPQTVFISLKP